jgi:hypothetical protein
MSYEARSSFLLVRSHADLAHAIEKVTAYFSFLRQRSSFADYEAILGVWIDEEGVANLPCELILPGAAGTQRTVRILETTGVNGIWMLCGLDTAVNTLSRIDLVAALLEYFGHDDLDTLHARFIPTISGYAPDASGYAELAMLEAHYPQLILSPMCDEVSGKLVLPSSTPGHQGTSI